MKRFLLIAMVLGAGCEGSHRSADAGPVEGDLECPGDSFMRARVAFPGQEPFDTGCMTLEPWEIATGYSTPACVLDGACANADGPAHHFMFCAWGAWWETPGLGTDWFGIQYDAVGEPLCYMDAWHCLYSANMPYRCSFEVVQAGSELGDVVEARLAAPCELVGGHYVDGGGVMDPVAPTVLEFRVRGHLTLSVPGVPDAGRVCLDAGAS